MVIGLTTLVVCLTFFLVTKDDSSRETGSLPPETTSDDGPNIFDNSLDPPDIGSSAPSGAVSGSSPLEQPSMHAEPPSDSPSIRPPFEGYVFCYGDSLTAGLNEPNSGNHTPYGPSLEEALTGEYPDPLNRFDTNAVDYRGVPGWTAVQLVEVWNRTKLGLGYFLDTAPREFVDVVIIMVGTNDVRNMDEPDATYIFEHVRALHEESLLHPKVKRTLAVEIPGGAYRSNNPTRDAAALAVNEMLLEFASVNPRVHHTPFPFPYEQDGPNWSSDRLHFSVEGNRVLGVALAPVVRKIVEEEDS